MDINNKTTTNATTTSPQKRFNPIQIQSTQRQQEQNKSNQQKRFSLNEVSNISTKTKQQQQQQQQQYQQNEKNDDNNKFKINLNTIEDKSITITSLGTDDLSTSENRNPSPIQQPIWKSFIYDPNTSIYLIKKEKIVEKFLIDKQYLKIAQKTNCTINLHENTNDTNSTVYFKVIGSYESRCNALELLRNETDKRGVIVNLPLNLNDTNKNETQLKDTRRYSSNKNLTRINSINYINNNNNNNTNSLQDDQSSSFRPNSVIYRKSSASTNTTSGATSASHMKRTKSYQNKFDLPTNDYNNNSYVSNLYDYEFDLTGNRASLEDKYLFSNQPTSFYHHNHHQNKASSVRISTFNKQDISTQQQQQQQFINPNRPESYHQAQQNGFYMNKNHSYSNYNLNLANNTSLNTSNLNKSRKTLSFSSTKPENNPDWNTQQYLNTSSNKHVNNNLHRSATTSQLNDNTTSLPTQLPSQKSPKTHPPKRYTIDFLLQRADTDESKKQPENWSELNLKFPNICFNGRVISYFNPNRYEAYWTKTKELNQDIHVV